MCASYESRFSVTELRLDFTLADRQLPLNLEARPAIRPTDAAPYIFAENGDRLLSTGRFGLWQPWMAGKKPPPSTFNVKAETAMASRMWRPLLTGRRALVPAVAYHEWTGEPGAKTRWRYTVDGGAPFAFAGVYCVSQAVDGAPKGFAPGERVSSFALFTCAPNTLAAQHHARMPVILDPTDYAAWLNPANADPEALLRPFPTERMMVGEADAV